MVVKPIQSKQFEVSVLHLASYLCLHHTRLYYFSTYCTHESKFDGLLSLVKEYIMDVWEIRKHKLYDSDSGPGKQLHSRSSSGERNGKFSQNGKFGQNGKLGTHIPT